MIGWYVHHHGRGHLARASAVAAHVGEPVVGLSSLPDPGRPFAGWVQLTRDDLAAAPRDPTAGGALHWAPVGDPRIARRAAEITGWLASARPRLVVVDVSVETAVLVRTAGVPVVVVALPGERDDPAHRLGYAVADRVLAFWPREVYDPPWLRPWSPCFVGAVSRFDGAPPGGAGGGVVVLRGTGDAEAVSLDLPADWHVLGGATWSDDPWPRLARADVVVTHAGQNALAEVAAARRPAVVVAVDRPYGEQRATARALAAAGIAVTASGWTTAELAGPVAAAAGLGGDGWRRWSSGRGAQRAAALIAAVA